MHHYGKLKNVIFMQIVGGEVYGGWHSPSIQATMPVEEEIDGDKSFFARLCVAIDRRAQSF
jgi:hypothetical protein